MIRWVVGIGVGVGVGVGDASPQTTLVRGWEDWWFGVSRMKVAAGMMIGSGTAIVVVVVVVAVAGVVGIVGIGERDAVRRQ